RLQLRLISNYVPGRSLLDFGSGSGALVRAAIQAGWNAMGLDLNRGLVDAANAHWGFNVLRTGSLEDFVASTAERFDAIVSNQVFEHLQDPVRIGKMLFGLLRPGGVILIDVPN